MVRFIPTIISSFFTFIYSEWKEFILYLELPSRQEWWSSLIMACRHVMIAIQSCYIFWALTLRPFILFIWLLFNKVAIVGQFFFRHLLQGFWTSGKHGYTQIKWAITKALLFQYNSSRKFKALQLAILLGLTALYVLRKHIEERQYIRRAKVWYRRKKKRALKIYQVCVDKVSETSLLLAMILPHALFVGVACVVKILFPKVVSWLAHDTYATVILSVFYPFIWTVAVLFDYRHPNARSDNNNNKKKKTIPQSNNNEETNNNKNGEDAKQKTIKRPPAEAFAKTKSLSTTTMTTRSKKSSTRPSREPRTTAASRARAAMNNNNNNGKKTRTKTPPSRQSSSQRSTTSTRSMSTRSSTRTSTSSTSTSTSTTTRRRAAPTRSSSSTSSSSRTKSPKRVSSTKTNPRKSPPKKTPPKTPVRRLLDAATTPIRSFSSPSLLSESEPYDPKVEARYWLSYWIVYTAVSGVGRMLFLIPLVGRILARSNLVTMIVIELELCFYIWIFGLPAILTTTATSKSDHRRSYDVSPIQVLLKHIGPLASRAYRATSHTIPKKTWIGLTEKAKSFTNLAVMLRMLSESTQTFLLHILEHAHPFVVPGITLLMPGFITEYGLLYIKTVVPTAKACKFVTFSITRKKKNDDDDASTQAVMDLLEYYSLATALSLVLQWWSGILWWIPFSTHVVYAIWCYLQFPRPCKSWYDTFEEELQAFGLLPKGDKDNLAVERTVTATVLRQIARSLPSASEDDDIVVETTNNGEAPNEDSNGTLPQEKEAVPVDGIDDAKPNEKGVDEELAQPQVQEVSAEPNMSTAPLKDDNDDHNSKGSATKPDEENDDFLKTTANGNAPQEAADTSDHVPLPSQDTNTNDLADIPEGDDSNEARPNKEVEILDAEASQKDDDDDDQSRRDLQPVHESTEMEEDVEVEARDSEAVNPLEEEEDNEEKDDDDDDHSGDDAQPARDTTEMTKDASVEPIATDIEMSNPPEPFLEEKGQASAKDMSDAEAKDLVDEDQPGTDAQQPAQEMAPLNETSAEPNEIDIMQMDDQSAESTTKDNDDDFRRANDKETSDTEPNDNIDGDANESNDDSLSAQEESLDGESGKVQIDEDGKSDSDTESGSKRRQPHSFDDKKKKKNLKTALEKIQQRLEQNGKENVAVDSSNVTTKTDDDDTEGVVATTEPSKSLRQSSRLQKIQDSKQTND